MAVTDTSALGRLKRALKRDKVWHRFVEISKGAYRPEFSGFVVEMQKLHKTRTVRQLATAMPTGKRIGEAAMVDQSVRSRCTEICMDIMASSSYLSMSIDNMRRYILANYDEILVDAGATRITEKRTIVDGLFNTANSRLQQLYDILDVADLVIKDIDQAGWALARTTTALEIAVKREGA